MTAVAVRQIVESLQSAGLVMSLTDDRSLKVVPARNLTPELRDLIRVSKPLLVDWLVKSVTLNSGDQNTWRHLAAAYHAHHFACPTCIAAGLSYGQRCGLGMALWSRSQA